MHEVSASTIALVMFSIEHRGLSCERLWGDLPLSLPALRAGHGVVEWSTFVTMMARVEGACGPAAMTELFVPGSARQTHHYFAAVADTFLSTHDLYRLLARWGLRRILTALSGTYTRLDDRHGRFVAGIDRSHDGSAPILRFVGGALRAVPTLHGLAVADVSIAAGGSDHEMSYELALPPHRGVLSRARRMLRVAGGAAATIDEMTRQATEIAASNLTLTAQLAATERAAATLREREAWLGLALSAGNIGLWRWSRTRNRVWVSDGVSDLLGLRLENDIDPQVWADRIHEADRPRLTEVMSTALSGGPPLDVEYRIRRPDGELRWLHVKGQLVDEAGGEQVVFGTVADLTERRRMEDQLRSADRLIATGTLAVGLAHELNNPLTYVLGNLELLRTRLGPQLAGDPVTAQGLTDVWEGLARIRDVVANLRAFARPEEDAATRVELRAMCATAARVVSSLIRHRAELILDVEDPSLVVRGNESRVVQVLINLILNACDAMPDRPISQNQITVRARRIPTGEVQLQVSDNGVGIAPDLVARVFDPFFTTKAVGEGTGLGLAICHRTIAAMGGRITLETEVGRGTTFTIVLPAATADTSEPRPAAAPAPAPTDVRHERRVLVIDDEPLVRRVIDTMLRSRGFTVLQADGGRAGIAAATAEPGIELVLCDLMMPEIDGVEVHAELGRLRPDLQARMVFITGGAVSPRTRAFAERDDVTVLTKPFRVDDLLAAIESLAARAPALTPA
jgi:PAS domain S-box-containing protein